MPETTIKVAQVLDKKSKKGKDYWLIKDGNDEGYFAWESEMGQVARTAMDQGNALIIQYEEENGYKTAKSVSGPVQDPKPGDGTWVKGKENPDTQRSIVAAVALDKAVRALAHTIPTSATAKDAAQKIEPLADEFFLWLTSKSGVQREEDVPF